MHPMSLTQQGQQGAIMQPGQPNIPGAMPQVPGQPGAPAMLPGIPGQPGAAGTVPGVSGPVPLGAAAPTGMQLPAGPGGPIPTSPIAGAPGTAMAKMYPGSPGMMSTMPGFGIHKPQPGIIETDAPDGELSQVPGWLRDYVTIPVKPKRHLRRDHHGNPIHGSPQRQSPLRDKHGGHFRQTH
jgi:hypothetical protein